jgi:hypothetical protein
MGQYINEAKRFQKLAKIITESQLSEGYKFDDADEATAKEIEAKIKPAIEGTIKKAMMDIIAQNPELKGAPNYGLAVGNVAYKIVMDSIKENSNTPQSQLNEDDQILDVGHKFANGMEIKYAVGTKFDTSALPDSTRVPHGVWVITRYQPNGVIDVKCESGEAEGKTAIWNMGSLQYFIRLGLKPVQAESLDQTIDEALEAHRKQK